MQQPHAQSLIGTVVQGRYIIEEVLGEGGFSTVYLVRDQHVSDKPDAPDEPQHNLFALKVLTDEDQGERNHFVFEHVVLEWLDHPALPRIHRMFEDDNHTYLLMDYIAGPNLETLRKQQVGKRFSLSQVLTMLAPIVEAITYLHRQQPPIVHCDIKPSNIIVPQAEGKGVLVDFGIAKKYDPDATITAIQHCTPGYGAPEQYSYLGTDQRTDIYGLAATCYVLLTGIPPTDSLQRATSLASKGIDPLVSPNLLVPTLPGGVTDVIRRAMSIGSDDRFATVEEFWQALDDAKEVKSKESPQEDVQVSSSRIVELPLQSQTQFKRSFRTTVLISILAALLLIIGSGFGFWSYAMSQHRSQSDTLAPLATSTPTLQKKLTPNTASNGVISANVARITGPYQGTIHSMLTDGTTPMYLSQIQQNNQSIQGTFKGLNRNGPFVGVLDTSKHIFFTVGGTGPAPLFFQGSVRSDGNLVGTYCSLDPAGQCAGEYGLWSVGP